MYPHNPDDNAAIQKLDKITSKYIIPVDIVTNAKLLKNISSVFAQPAQNG